MFRKQIVIVLSFFWNEFSPMGQLPGASPPLTFGLASNESMSLHDVTTATVTATKTINNIKEKFTEFT